MLGVNVCYTDKIKSSGSSVISKMEEMSHKGSWCTRHTLISSNDESTAQMHDFIQNNRRFIEWLLGQDFLQLIASHFR
jgi:hypothetical protein